MCYNRIKLIILGLVFFSVPLFSSEAITDDDVRERLSFIGSRFNDAEFYTRFWSCSRLGVNSTLTAFYAANAVFGSSLRSYYIVSSVKSAVIEIYLIVFPFYPAAAARNFRNIPDESPAERREKLFWAEIQMKRNYEQVKRETSFLMHVYGILLSIASGGFVWALEGSDGWKPALLNMCGGIITAELNILTMPENAVRDYDDYRERFYGLMTRRAEPVNYFFGACPGGLRAGLYF